MRRMNRAQIDGIELAYELRGSGRAGRLDPLGRRLRVGRAASPRARARGELSASELPPRRFRRQQPRDRTDQHGRPREALQPVAAPAGDRPGPHRRPFLECRDRAAACARLPGGGGDDRAHGCRPTGPCDGNAAGVRANVRRSRRRALSRRRPGRRGRHLPARSLRSRITGNRSRRGYRAPSTAAWKRRMRSSRRSSRPFRRGRSPGRTPLVSRNPCSVSSGNTRPRPFRSAGSCCSRCFPTPKRSTFPERRTFCIWRTRRERRRRWPPSSRGIRSPFMPDCVSPGRMGRMFIERPTSEAADGPGSGISSKTVEPA